jgi:TonB family protein
MSKRAGAIILFLAALLIIVSVSQTSPAQSPVMTMTLGPNDLGVVSTATGITTRISFGETVKQVICGDLYDPLTGKGKFLVQTMDNEVYIKPVTDKGTSNLFVKVGEKKGDHRTYNFDLLIVPVEQANRVVNVISAATLAAAANKKAESEDLKTSKKPSQPPVLERSRAAEKAAQPKVSGKETKELDNVAIKDHSIKRVLAMYPPVASQPLKTGTEMVLGRREKNMASNEVDEGEAIKQVYPEYPELARLMQVTGAVNVAIDIDKQGKVTTARAVSGPQMLRDAAVAAARAWEFAQTKVGGKPVAGSKILTFNFKLAKTINNPDQAGTAPPVDREQELKSALEMIQKSLSVDPKNTLLLSSTGWIYFHLGQLEEAVRYLGEAAKHEPKNSEVQERFGDVCFSLGRKTDAEQAWMKALNEADGGEQKDRINTKLAWVKQ